MRRAHCDLIPSRRSGSYKTGLIFRGPYGSRAVQRWTAPPSFWPFGTQRISHCKDPGDTRFGEGIETGNLYLSDDLHLSVRAQLSGTVIKKIADLLNRALSQEGESNSK